MIRIPAIVITAFLAVPALAGDLEKLARELERVLGRGSVELRGSEPARAGEVRLSAVMLVNEMNRERASRGLSQLRLDGQLSMAAEDRIDDMFDKRYFDHVSPEGTQPFIWAARRGYDYRSIGENLAVGYRTSLQLVEGWMGSAGHRKNILGDRYTDVGIAIAAGSPTSQFAGPTVVAIYGSR